MCCFEQNKSLNMLKKKKTICISHLIAKKHYKMFQITKESELVKKQISNKIKHNTYDHYKHQQFIIRYWMYMKMACFKFY